MHVPYLWVESINLMWEKCIVYMHAGVPERLDSQKAPAISQIFERFVADDHTLQAKNTFKMDL